MDYITWAEEYERDAEKIQAAIERKKALKRKRLTADQKQLINSQISSLKTVYHEMLSMAHLLRERGKNHD